MVYLRVRERVVSAIEDPDLHEKALGPVLPGTTLRLRVAWQVLVTRDFKPQKDLHAEFEEWIANRRRSRCRAAVRVERPEGAVDDPCVIDPDAAYRGPENQLYCIEVHRGGEAGTATFKWSRDNGSVVYTVSELEGEWATISGSSDDKVLPEVEDWVEMVNDSTAGGDEPGPLLQVTDVDFGGRRVRLSGVPANDCGRDPAQHPFLRRWDHRAGGRGAPRPVGGALPIAEDDWLTLEHGVQVRFEEGGVYRSGQFWTVAARTLDGQVEWPQADGEPESRPPAGPDVHYAPLKWFRDNGESTDMRMKFASQSERVEG